MATMVVSTAAAMLAPASQGLRRHHRPNCSVAVLRRALIGRSARKRLQVGGHLSRGLVPPLRLLGDRLEDQRLQVTGDAADRAARPRWLGAEHPLDQLHPLGVVEGRVGA